MNRAAIIIWAMLSLTVSTNTIADTPDDYGQYFTKNLCPIDFNMVADGYPMDVGFSITEELLSADYFIDVWENHFFILHDNIPHPSLSQKAWIDGELNSSDYNRQTDTYNSLAYKKLSVSQWTHKAQALITAAKSSHDVVRDRFLIRFAYHLNSMPIADFYILREKGYLSGLTKRDENGALLGYDAGFIPNQNYNFLYGNSFQSKNLNVLYFVSSCLLSD